MNVYIDLGSYKGIMMSRVIKTFDEIDLFVAFEPVPNFFHKLKKKFGNNSKVKLYNSAAGVADEKKELYLCKIGKKKIGQGSTLIPGVYDSSITVKSINFSKYLKENFKISDNIILKIDIEGYEYNLLEHLVETGNIKYINNIFCEWHLIKLKKRLGRKSKAIKMHSDLVNKLQELGFNLTGENSKDEFSVVHRKVRKSKGTFLRERVIKGG